MFRNQPQYKPPTPPTNIKHVQTLNRLTSPSSHPLEKPRALSHKKISITSPSLSHVSSVKHAQMPIQMSKFYKPIPLHTQNTAEIQQKKIGFEDGKISLKLSQGFGSPIKSNQASRVQMFDTRERRFMAQNMGNEIEFKKMQADMKQFMNAKYGLLTSEINCQNRLITDLRVKIEELNFEIAKKGQIIESLRHEKLNNPQNQQAPFILKMQDMKKQLQIIRSESHQAQMSLNSKLETLTKKVVQLSLSKRDTQGFRKSLQNVTKKMNDWIECKQRNINKIEKTMTCLNLPELSSAMTTLKQIRQKVELLQSNNSFKQSERVGEHKTSDAIASTWQSFQDFISGDEVPNTSMFAQDDFFFHPGTITNRQKVKSSRHSSTFTSTTCDSRPNESLQKITTIMEYLRNNYSSELPLKCWIDKHSRIVVAESKKVLQDPKTESFFKITQDQASILQKCNYVRLAN